MPKRLRMLWLWFGKNFPILTEKRKDKLADYCLNMSVASFAVGVYEGKWIGCIASILFFWLFLYLTKDHS